MPKTVLDLMLQVCNDALQEQNDAWHELINRNPGARYYTFKDELNTIMDDRDYYIVAAMQLNDLRKDIDQLDVANIAAGLRSIYVSEKILARVLTATLKEE